MAFAGGVFNHEDIYTNMPDGHFEAMFFALVRSYMHKPVIAECANQYGLYPLFLTPLFRLFDLSVTSYSMFMSLLVAGIFLALYLVCRRVISNRWLSLGLFCAMAVFCHLALKPYHLNFLQNFYGVGYVDPYFQMTPLRMLFPTLTLLIATAAARRGATRQLWVGHLLLPLGILWNLESGLLSISAWLAFVLHRDWVMGQTPMVRARDMLRHGGSCLAALPLLLGAASGIYYLTYNQFPQIGLLTEYQRIFALTGYGMLPLPNMHPWMIVLLIYALALAYAAKALFGDSKSDHDSSLVLLLSVLGVGLFTYFQGRSHYFNLMTVSFPAWLLVGIFLDRNLPRPFVRPFAALLVLILGSWTLTGFYATSQLLPQISARWSAIGQQQTPMITDLEFVRARTHGAMPLIISMRASTYYLLGGLAPPMCPSIPEIIKRSDLDALIKKINNATGELFVDRMLIESRIYATNQAPLIDFLMANFDIHATSPSGRLLALVPKM